MSFYAMCINFYAKRQCRDMVKSRGSGIRLPGFDQQYPLEETTTSLYFTFSSLSHLEDRGNNPTIYGCRGDLICKYTYFAYNSIWRKAAIKKQMRRRRKIFIIITIIFIIIFERCRERLGLWDRLVCLLALSWMHCVTLGSYWAYLFLCVW